MIFRETRLSGAHLIEPEPHSDHRGLFARVWCRSEFGAHDLSTEMVQGNVSYNHHAGTIRGLHLQRAPRREAKLVWCTRGAIYDVVVDLRKDSATHREWLGVELTAENRRMLYVPEGFAHGYQTLADESEVMYLVSEFYSPDQEAGIRFDDPAIGVEWPIGEPTHISEKDASWPLLEET